MLGPSIRDHADIHDVAYMIVVSVFLYTIARTLDFDLLTNHDL